MDDYRKRVIDGYVGRQMPRGPWPDAAILFLIVFAAIVIWWFA